MDEIKPCQEIHKIDNQVPRPEDVQLDGRVCDCGRILFYKERCSCPAETVNPSYTLKAQENPNYIPNG